MRRFYVLIFIVFGFIVNGYGQGTMTATPPSLDFGSVCLSSAPIVKSFTINGTNLTSQDISIGALAGFTYSTTSNGTYTASLSLTPSAATYTQDIYVKFSPIASQSYNGSIPISGGGAPSINVDVAGTGLADQPVSVSLGASATTICAGNAVTFTATPTNGGTPSYQWQIEGINTGVATSSNQFTTDTFTVGKAVTVVMTSNEACATSNPATSNPIVMVVNQNPTATAGGPLAAICQGGTSAQMGGSVGGGATGGTWSGGAGTWTNANSPSTATYKASATESGTITLTLTTTGGSCGTTTATKTITVNQNPTATAGGPLSAICQGGTSAQMGGSVGGGATGGTWSGGAGTWTNANSPSTATYKASATESGTITLTLTTTGGSCGTTTATKTITVNQNPTATAGGPLSAICQGGTSAQMGGSVGGGATGGTWSGGAGTWTNANSPSTATYKASATESGTITLTLTTTGGSCGTTTATKTITVNQNPTATAGGPLSAICQGGTSAQMGGSVGGGATGGTWSGGAGTWTNGNDPSTATYKASATESGTITLTLTTTGGSCGTTTVTKTITVNQNPTATAGGPLSAICQGGTSAQMGGSVGGGATGGTWSGGAGTWTNANDPSTATYKASATESGTITLTLTTTGGSCATATVNKQITVNPTLVPSVSITSTSTNICTGSGGTAVTFSIASSANIGSNPTYQWKLNGANIGGATGASYTANSLADGSQISLALTSNATCASPGTVTSTPITMKGYMAPAVPVFVASSSTVNIPNGICPPASGLVYTVTADPNVTTYNWTVPSGWTITSGDGTNSITVNVTTASVTGNTSITVSAQNACGKSSNSSFGVSISNSAGVTAGTDTSVCQGNSIVLSGTQTGYVNKVQWSAPSGAFINSTSLTPTYTPGISSGTVTLTLTMVQSKGNSNCSVVSSKMNLTIKPTATASIIVSGPNPICSGTPANIQISATPNTIVTYKIGSGSNQSINIDNSGVYTLNTGNLSTNITYSLVSVAYPGLPCSQSVTGSATVNVTAAPTSVAGTAVTTCSNSGAVNITAGSSATNYGTVSWTSNGTGTIANANSLTTATYTPGANETGTITLTLTATGNSPCANAVSTKNLTITAAPASVAGTAVTTCSNSGAVNITAGSSASNYGTVTWTSNGTGTIANANSLTTATYTPGANETGTITLTLTASGNSPCADAVSTKTLTITAAPTSVAGTAVTTCSNSGAVNITAGSSASNYGTITWTSSGTGAIANANSLTAATYTPAAGETGTVTLTLTATGNSSCGNTVSTKNLTITAAPASVAGTAVTTCSNSGAVNITAGSSASNYATLTWTSNGTGTIANANSLTTATYTPGANETGTITLTLTANGNSPCGDAVSTKSLTINQEVIITTQPNPSQAVCLSFPASLSVAATGTGLTYQWYLGGTSLAGATSSTYNIAKAQLSDGGTYTVVVSGAGNVCTAQTSNQAVLTVNQTITATVAPASQTQCEGGTATFTVSTTGGTVTSYQWRKNGNSIFDGGNISGAKTATLTITGVTPGADAGNYDVVVSGPAGQCSQVISNVASLAVTPTVGTPVFALGTTSSRCQSAGTVTYSATAMNTTGITYSLDATSTSAGNSIDAASGIVTYVAGWTGTSVITASAAGCNGPITSTHTVTVNATPVVTTANTAMICSGTSPNISLAASVPSSFSWTIGTITGGITGGSSASGSAINQALTNPSNTAGGSVQYIVTPTASTGSCAGTPYIITVTVNPKPVVTTPATATTCSGTSPNISLAASVPSTFSWTVGTVTGGITGASSGSGAIINQPLTNPGNSAAGTVQYIITPTATTGGCGGDPYTITVTVNPKPVITTPATAITCSGTSPNISLAASVPSTFSWTIGTVTGGITGASSGSGAIINQPLTNPGNSTAGTVQYIITPTATTGGCAGDPYTITVSVNPKPVVTTPATAAPCSGTSPNISLGASVPSTFSWTIGTVTGGITGASSGSGSAISQTLTNPGNSAAGTVQYIITPTATTGGCAGDPYTITVTVNPKPVITTPATAATCSGTSPNISLAASVPSTFSWAIGTVTGGITGASSGSGAIINQPLTNPGNSTAGTVQYIITPTATTGGCTGNPYTITVTVNATPAVTTPSTASVCTGSSPKIALTASASGISSFSWTIGTTSGVSGASAGTGTTIDQILNTTGSTIGNVTYLVTPTSAAGCVGAVYPITVSVSPLSTGGNLSPKLTTACQNATGTITLGGNTGSIIKWQQSINGGTNWTDLSNTTNTYAYGPLTQTTSYRAVIQSGPCSVAYSDTAVVSVVPPMKPNPVTPTPRTICVGDTSVLTSGTGYPTIGITDSSGLFNTASNNSGWGWNKCYTNSCLSASGDNGNATPWLLTNSEKVNPPLIAYFSSDNKFAVVRGSGSDWGNGDTSVLETPAFSLIGQTSSVFQFSQGYVLTTTGASVSIEISTDGGKTYSAILSQVKGVATSPGLSGSTITLQPASISLANYIGLSNLKIRFKYTGAAGSSWALDNIQLPATLPITYQWSDTTKPGTTIITPPSQVPQTPITVDPVVTTTYTITTYVGGCYAGSDTVTVFVNPLPKYGTVSQAAAVCSGTSAIMNLTGLTPGIASTIVYNIDGGTSQTVTVTADATGNGSFPVTLVTGNQKLTITSITNKVSANTRSCSVAPNIFAALTVNPLPTATIAGGPFCQTGNGTITVSNQTGGPFTNGNFTATPAGLQINSSGVINLASSTAGTYTVSYTFTGANGCGSGSGATAQVIVNPQATITTQPSDITFCPESGVGTVSVTSQLANPAFNYNWQVNDGSGWQPVTGADYSSATTTTATTATNTLTISNVTNGNTKDGYLYSVQITGAGGSCAVPSNPAKLTIHNIWHGYTNTDWNLGSNWSDGAVPTLTCDSVIILNVTNKPILSTGAEGAVNHLVIRPGATVTVDGNILHIAGGIWDNNGALNATTGTIDLNGNLAIDGVTPRPMQTIAGKMFFTPKGTNSGRIMNLQISSPHGATVAGPTVTDTLNITGSLSFGNVSNVTLNTGDNITLISDAAGTARVADATNGGTNSGNNINGKVIVERFFNATRKWKFLSVPTSTDQTVKQAWQEGATASTENPAPGYGTQVTDHVAPTAANGFDYDSPSGPSVKAYNSSNDLWDGIATTFVGIKNPAGWMTFVRGDRTAIGFNAAANNTVLRTKGVLFQGNQVFPTQPYTFTSVGNPYASTIDMRRIQLSGQLGPFFTLWNPNLTGVEGLGAYQTYSLDGTDYVPTPSGGGATNNDIQSGQAFFVQSPTKQVGTVTFTEPAKKSGFNTSVFRAAETGLQQQLRTNLLVVNADGSTVIADGTFQQFDEAYSNKTDNNDARKFLNPGLNLSVKSANDLLVIERRRLPAVTDTVFFNLTGVSVRNYRFQFIAKGLADAGIQPLLEDRYLNTITPLSQEDTTYINFKIENIKGSYASNRFDIIFKASPVLPAAITSIAASVKDQDIQVDWKVTREKNVQQYEVERSFDGIQFTTVATMKANNTGTADYSWLDPKVLPGYYYYRVKSTDAKGKVQYTKIVTVLIGTGKPSFTIYPNPIRNGIINVQFINQRAGKYGIRLMNQLGQIIVSKQIERMNGSSNESIKWDYNLAHGIYQLEILQPNGEIKIIKVLY